MITEISPLGHVLVLVLHNGTLVEEGTPVDVLEVGPCTYLEYATIHRVVDKKGRIRAMYSYEINVKWVKL